MRLHTDLLEEKSLDTGKKRRKRAVALTIIVSVLLLLAFIFVYYASYETYITNEEDITVQHFTEMATSGKALVLINVDRLRDSAKNTASMLTFLRADRTTLSDYFTQQLPNAGARAAIITTEDGTSVYDGAGSFHLSHHTTDEYSALIQEEIPYSAAFAATARQATATGDCVISDLQDCGDDGGHFCTAIPLTLKDGRKAVLTLIYPQSVLNELMDSVPSSDTTRLCIMDSYGNFVATQTMKEPWVTPGQFVLDSETTDRLTTVTALSDQKQYVAYAKSIGVNDWYVLYVMPKTVLDAQTQAGSNRIHLFGTACLLFGVLIFGAGLYKNRIRYYRLKLFKQKFRIATLQSARAAFEYDKKRDSLCLISECEHIHLPKPSLNLSELAACVHPADRPLYGQAVIELRRDGTTSTTLRAIHFAEEDAYRWYHITATRLTDKGEGKALTIGTLEDIDEREKERLILAEKATKDCLTGLCNRAETEEIVRKRLAGLGPDDHSAFAIIDLDNFKNINDEYGHECGDRALLFFAEKLRATFRFGDVIGRLGGDEFIVYMTLTSDKEIIKRRMKELMDSLEMHRSDDAELPPITCSVGCCIASRGDSFEDLYKSADAALYESKACGKGHATMA